jgi:hypothetical protein
MPALDSPLRAVGAPRAAKPTSTQLIITTLLVLLYVASRLWHLTGTCLWFDEIFSLHAARHTWVELWRFAAADLIHPPLFYALLKIWTASGGESLLWLRLLPALISIAALVPFLLLARELRLSPQATNFALLLLAANGYLIKYAQELRMYSLLLFLSLVSLWLFAKLRRAPRATRSLLLALTIANLLLVYTHYYGLLLVACEAIFLAFKDRRKLAPFLLACAAVALLFAPWVAACVGASREGGGLAQNVGWIERPRAADLAQLFALLNEPFYFRQSSDQPLYARGGMLLGLLLTGLPIAALLLRTLRRRTKDTSSRDVELNSDAERDEAERDDTKRDDVVLVDARLDGTERFERGCDNTEHGTGHGDAVSLLVFFTLLPIALAFVASYALPVSVWGTRHLIIVAAPYTLLAGLALCSLRTLWLKSTALVLLCCWFLTAGALTLLRSDPSYIWCAWDGLARSAVKDEATAQQANAGTLETNVATQQSNANAGTRETDARVAPVNLYAFEDLVAYHLWFTLDTSGERRMKVNVLKGMQGVAEDPAYFLPRHFDGIATSNPDALKGERFYAAFRAATWNESQPPLKNILEHGYRAERIYEASVQGQRAFLVLFVRNNVEQNPPR